MDPQSTPQVAASQFSQVYKELGIDPGKLGCLMLDLEPITVSDTIFYDDLYQSDSIEHPHQQGITDETWRRDTAA